MTRVLAVLLAALATACAAAAGFAEAPRSSQLVLLVAACVFAGALQMVAASKKPLQLHGPKTLAIAWANWTIYSE